MKSYIANFITKHKRTVAVVTACFVLAVSGAVFIGYESGRVYRVCLVEAGVSVKPADFVKREGDTAELAPESGGYDINVPGDYPLQIQCGLFTHDVVLQVRDTIPPFGLGVDHVIDFGKTLTAEEFVTQVEDVTPVSIVYEKEPDFKQYGRQPVGILLKDAGGNVTRVEAWLTVSKVKTNVVVEAGGEPLKTEDFLLADADASFLTDLKQIDWNGTAEYAVELEVEGERFRSSLRIVDTTPPQARVKSISGFTKVTLEPEEFIVEDSIVDVSEVSSVYRKTPDYTKTGTQKVELVLRDASGNETVKETTLTLEEDTEPPVITGASDLTVMAGDSISYKKKVKVSDNCSRGLVLSVDAGAVNLNAEGTYPVIYTAQDAAGNQAVKEITVTVRPKSYNLDEIYAAADRILAEITTPGMSLSDKATAIYWWNRKNLHYVDHSAKVNWQQGAYDGLIRRRGDCYTYAMTAKVLLTRAGIPNWDIVKIPARTMHYWNVVDVGTGPLHLDTTPRLDHPVILLWTDEQLASYSARHNKSHNYDRNVYTIFSAQQPLPPAQEESQPGTEAVPGTAASAADGA